MSEQRNKKEKTLGMGKMSEEMITSQEEQQTMSGQNDTRTFETEVVQIQGEESEEVKTHHRDFKPQKIWSCH